MKKMRKNDIKMVRNLTKRKQKKLSGGDDIDPNSFVEINTFVKQEVFDARK